MKVDDAGFHERQNRYFTSALLRDTTGSQNYFEHTFLHILYKLISSVHILLLNISKILVTTQYTQILLTDNF